MKCVTQLFDSLTTNLRTVDQLYTTVTGGWHKKLTAKQISTAVLSQNLAIHGGLQVIEESNNGFTLNSSIYSKLILFTDSKYELNFLWLHVQITEQRLVKMLESLCTQTGLHCLTSQILNTRVWFLDIWYTPFTSVQYNLDHGLAIITLSLNYTTPLVKIWIRSDMPSSTIPDTVYLPCALNWDKLVWTGHSHPKQVLI